jgi:hypothetical protein
LQIEEVLLSTTKLTPARVAEVVGACAMIGIPVKRVGLHFEPISAAELGWVMPSAEEAPRVSVPPSPLLGVPEPTLVSAKPHSAEH